MSHLTDPAYVRTEYRDASNLNARAALHERFSTDGASWQRWVFEHLEVPETARILELGCGPGKLWAENLECLPAGWGITLTDLSSGMLEEAKKALAESSHLFTFQVADAQNLPSGAATFDAVIANHMLYHLPDVDGALAGIRQVLNPGGKLYAATNGEGHLAELDEMLAGMVAAEAGTSNKILSFQLETGEALLAKHFAHVKLHPFQSALEVTEVAPLLAYILSMAPVKLYLESYPEEAADKLHTLQAALEQRLLENGSIHISKATGLFEALT